MLDLPWLIVDFVCTQVRWSNRYRGDRGKTCLTTVDGTDYRVFERTKRPGVEYGRGRDGRRLTVNPKWFSQKFNGPAVRYEIAVCIQTGDIVWTNGPFPAGRWPDEKIFKHKLIHKLDDDEMVEVDNTYSGLRAYCRLPGDYVSDGDRTAKTNARARHETINKRLKQWGCLGHRFRHHLNLHGMFFRACVVMTQLSFENGFPPFQVHY